MNPIRQIRTFNAGREPERLQLKYRRMRENAFLFMRGTCHLFYARLARAGGLGAAPPAWCCGDLHLENFGSYRGDNGLVHFDVNDHDEAALAPAHWDLLRLLSSLEVAAASAALGRARRPDGVALARTLLQAYAQALALGKSYWVERDTATGPVRALLERVRERDRAKFLDARTQPHGKSKSSPGRRLRIDTGKALPASRAQRAIVEGGLATFARAQPDPRFYEPLDVARRIAGTGSLGVERYVVLVRGGPDGLHLLDLKHALPSSLSPRLGAQPRWPDEAQRIVALQQRLQAVSMARLHALKVAGRPFVLRELQPSEDRVALDGLGRGGKDMTQFAATLGRLLAWAQLRSAGRQGSATADALIDFAQRKLLRPKGEARLLEAARASAEQVLADARRYAEAYDDGAFAL